MVNYDPAGAASAQVLPFVDLPTVTTPVTAAWLNHVDDVLEDIAAASARIPDLEAGVQGAVVAKNFRTTDFGPWTSTTVRVISTRGPIVSGRSYQVTAFGEVLGISGAVVSQHELRYTTNDTEPTTSSTFMARTIHHNAQTSSIPTGVFIQGRYDSSVTGFLRVVVTSQRVVGSVDCYWECTDNVMELLITDLGPTVANSGTLY